MKVIKYIGFGIGGLAILVLFAFGAILFFMASSSKTGKAKIDSLEKEFAIGHSIEGLIERAEALNINSLSWEADNGKESFEDDSGIPKNDLKNLSRPGLDFNLAKEKFRFVKSGNIQILAYGSAVLERFILSIDFVDRKVTKTNIRIID